MVLRFAFMAYAALIAALGVCALLFGIGWSLLALYDVLAAWLG